MLGVLGSHSARQAQLRAGEATGLGRVPKLPGRERALGGDPSPGKQIFPAQRWVAESSSSQPRQA